MGDHRPEAHVLAVRPGDETWGVITLQGGGDGVREEPCPPCPWRLDAPVGAFPPEVYRHSANTSEDASMRGFACHTSDKKHPLTCAGFILRGAGHNLRARVAASTTDFSGVHSDVALYENYRAMAVANGVDPDDPALATVRDDTACEWPSHKDATETETSKNG